LSNYIIFCVYNNKYPSTAKIKVIAGASIEGAAPIAVVAAFPVVVLAPVDPEVPDEAEYRAN